MAGWPARISRALLGPQLANLIEPPNQRNFIGQATFTIAWWVIAGLSKVGSKAWFAFDGTDATLLGTANEEHGEVWHPDGGDGPSVLYNSTGNYTFTYASTEPDELGNEQAISLKYAKAFPQVSATNINATALVTGGNVVEVRTYRADNGAPADADCFVEVY